MELEYKKLRCLLVKLGVSPLGALVVARCAEFLEVEPTEVKKTFVGLGMRKLPRPPTYAMLQGMINAVANRYMACNTKDGRFGEQELKFYPVLSHTKRLRYKNCIKEVINKIFSEKIKYEISKIGIWID